ncbi:MAG: hypothetical protein SFZ02_12235 [bacterium]|nr:hypothetical protein [bacterium]
MTHNLPFFAGENRLSLVQTAKAIGISPAKITSLKSRWQLDGLWQRVYDRLVGHLMSETKITNLKILSAFPTIVDSLLERLEQTKSDKAFGELLTIYMSLHKDVATSADASMEESARSYLADTLAGKPGDIQESNVPPPTNPPTGQMQTDPADGDS